MKRFALTVLAAALASALLFSTGCQPKVEVKTGTRIVCTYGEVISDTTRNVKVAKNAVAGYHVSTETTTCDMHRKLEALYDGAQTDIEAGNLTAAQAKLTQVVAGDPAFKKASEQLGLIAAKKKPTADRAPSANGTTPAGTPAPTNPTPGTEDPTGPVESLLQWTPDVIPGFTTPAKAGSDALTISRTYLPAKAGTVGPLVIVAEQYRDAAAAKAGLVQQIKQAYTRDAATVTVNGHEVYFGTDGHRFAALGFTSGGVMVALEMSTASGTPLSLKSDLIAAVKVLP